jgi:hypothetical protein
LLITTPLTYFYFIVDQSSNQAGWRIEKMDGGWKFRWRNCRSHQIIKIFHCKLLGFCLSIGTFFKD